MFTNELVIKINDNRSKRDAVRESRDIVSRKLDEAFNSIMALDLDSDNFEIEHARLNGQHTILSELYCDLTSKLAGLVEESKGLLNQAYKNN